ncbi:hypothetical protein [Maribacter sp. 2308TA10-17]|uniref:hypothetical protein n=1 Tax=Maribacter sp. 2308TA10-17 TaxID=3386276 RepID=UPI0039BC86A4
MNKKNFILSVAMGLALVNGVFANSPNKDIEVFDINTIEYIEDEEQVELGFDVADYLPEGFDPYKMYVDLNAIEYIEEEIEISDFTKYLPEGFDAYSYPTDIQSINYIDESDSFTIDFDTKKHLPEGFNAYIK